MIYKEHKPARLLEKYIACYYSLEYERGSTIVDHAFATGCVEVMFTLEGNLWETSADGAFVKTSTVEVWGQILKPLTFRVSDHSKVFGIRFHPSAASFFLNEDVSLLNDKVVDLTSVVGNSIRNLHSRLQEAVSEEQRVEIVDGYLFKKLADSSKSTDKIELVFQVMNELSRKDFFDNIENVARRYGITARHLQTLFTHRTGLSPKLYSKINRFQNSLVMLGEEGLSLTDVAHSCGILISHIS